MKRLCAQCFCKGCDLAMTAEPRKMNILVILLVWLLLSVLAAYVGGQLHATLLTVVAAWLQSDLPRPLGWATWTLAPISRASILVLGSVWVMGVIWLERDLGLYPLSRNFWARVGKLLAWLVGVLVICWVLVLLLSL